MKMRHEIIMVKHPSRTLMAVEIPPSAPDKDRLVHLLGGRENDLFRRVLICYKHI